MTVISHAHKFIFICPRKIGGTSLQISLAGLLAPDDVLSFSRPKKRFDPRFDETDFGSVGALSYQRQMRRHELPDVVRQQVGEKAWNEYFKFTVARNPWDIVTSFLWNKFGAVFYYESFLGRRSPADMLRNLPRALRLLGLRRRFERGDRKRVVECVLRERLYAGIEEIPQFYRSRGEPYADFTIRFDALQQDYDEVCDRLGLPRQSLPRTNTLLKPPDTDYRDYFTDYSKEYVANLCQSMIAAYGFGFDDGAGHWKTSGSGPRSS